MDKGLDLQGSTEDVCLDGQKGLLTTSDFGSDSNAGGRKTPAKSDEQVFSPEFVQKSKDLVDMLEESKALEAVKGLSGADVAEQVKALLDWVDGPEIKGNEAEAIRRMRANMEKEGGGYFLEGLALKTVHSRARDLLYKVIEDKERLFRNDEHAKARGGAEGDQMMYGAIPYTANGGISAVA